VRGFTSFPGTRNASSKFVDAAAAVKNLTSKPDNDTLLRLYALYKQGSVGQNTEEAPSRFNMINRAKWDAWYALSDMDQEDAQTQYVDLVDSLVQKDTPSSSSSSSSSSSAAASASTAAVEEKEYQFFNVSMPADKVAHVEMTTMTMPPDFFPELGSVFRTLAGREDVSVVVLSNQRDARGFSYGLDVQAAAGMLAGVTASKKTAPEMYQLVRNWQHDLSAIAELPVPVIAAVHSHCIGGGVDVVAAADVRIAASDAVFSVREAAIGITADLGSLQRLPSIIGEGNTRQLAFTAEDIDVSTAVAMNLVSPSVAEGSGPEVVDAALAMAQKIALNPRPALVGSKASLNHRVADSVDAGLSHVAMWNTSFLDMDVVAQAYADSMARRQK